MTAPEIVGLCVGCTVLAAFLWRVVRALYRIVRIGETALDRLCAVEEQLKTNGGNSARDVIDKIRVVAEKIHAVAVENGEGYDRLEHGQRRLEQGQQQAAALAGEAAQVAGTADQRIRQISDETRQWHRENQERLAQLEHEARERRMVDEAHLYLLKHRYDIDLDMSRADDRGDPPAPKP